MLSTITRLEAINIILSAIGSGPVNTIDEDTDIDVANATALLDKISRNVQRQGWDFNRGTYTMYPDVVTHKIRWDNSIIKFTSSNGTYAKRGDYLYDIDNKTFEFKDKIELEVTVALDFDDLPDCFKNYIAAQAAIEFQQKYLGDDVVSRILQFDLQEAKADIVQYDMDMGDHNMLQLTNIAEVLERN